MAGFGFPLLVVGLEAGHDKDGSSVILVMMRPSV